jgi:hypothetical protein
MFKLEIDSRWRLTAAREWARLVMGRFQIVVLGFDDETELRAQAREPQLN